MPATVIQLPACCPRHPGQRLRHGLSAAPVIPDRRKSCCPASAKQLSISDTTEAKRRIEQLAGPKHGLDKSDEEKREIAAIVEELGSLKRMDQLDMTGSRWRLVYSESTSSSAGKVGPFISTPEQEFPADKPGQYINWLYLGPVSISLLADYSQAKPDRIDVSFVWLQVQLGALKFKRDFKNRGTWDSIYVDPDFRAFRTNKKNIFVLKRMA